MSAEAVAWLERDYPLWSCQPWHYENVPDEYGLIYTHTVNTETGGWAGVDQDGVSRPTAGAIQPLLTLKRDQIGNECHCGDAAFWSSVQGPLLPSEDSNDVAHADSYRTERYFIYMRGWYIENGLDVPESIVIKHEAYMMENERKYSETILPFLKPLVAD